MKLQYLFDILRYPHELDTDRKVIILHESDFNEPIHELISNDLVESCTALASITLEELADWHPELYEYIQTNDSSKFKLKVSQEADNSVNVEWTGYDGDNKPLEEAIADYMDEICGEVDSEVNLHWVDTETNQEFNFENVPVLYELYLD